MITFTRVVLLKCLLVRISGLVCRTQKPPRVLMIRLVWRKYFMRVIGVRALMVIVLVKCFVKLVMLKPVLTSIAVLFRWLGTFLFRGRWTSVLLS